MGVERLALRCDLSDNTDVAACGCCLVIFRPEGCIGALWSIRRGMHLAVAALVVLFVRFENRILSVEDLAARFAGWRHEFMSQSINAASTLDNHFLAMRHDVLNLAAAFDRVRRTDDAESEARDPRMIMLAEALDVLADAQPDSAKRVQLVFSDSYDPHWREDS